MLFNCDLSGYSQLYFCIHVFVQTACHYLFFLQKHNAFVSKAYSMYVLCKIIRYSPVKYGRLANTFMQYACQIKNVESGPKQSNGLNVA